MDLLQRFQEHWKKQFPYISPANSRLLLAVSGGVDSVVLVDLLHQLKFDFSVGHCNFQLRGSESERDELFVRSLCEKYQKEILVKRFNTKAFAHEKKLSIQEAARELRYGWFGEIVNSWQVTDDSNETRKPHHTPHATHCILLTAHHADDNIETVLMHFFRGTGILGLSGIQPELKERKLIRPLLPFRKKELLAYAAKNELLFVEDSSNASDKYTRNYFRNQLLPQIKEIYPQAEENILHNIERMNEAGQLYRQAIDVQISKLLEQKGKEWHVPVLKWKKIKPVYTITWELIRPFGFHAAQTEEVIKLLDGENGGYQSSGTHRIIRNRNWMIIAPNEAAEADHVLIKEGQEETAFQNGALALHLQTHSPFTIHHSPGEASIDASSVQYPLLLRKWKAGDYFYPLGMQKKKKLGKFLIDLKLSRTEKEKVWVLESDKKILWVIGYRIDNRFRVTDTTQAVLQVAYRK